MTMKKGSLLALIVLMNGLLLFGQNSNDGQYTFEWNPENIGSAREFIDSISVQELTSPNLPALSITFNALSDSGRSE